MPKANVTPNVNQPEGLDVFLLGISLGFNTVEVFLTGIVIENVSNSLTFFQSIQGPDRLCWFIADSVHQQEDLNHGFTHFALKEILLLE